MLVYHWLFQVEENGKRNLELWIKDHNLLKDIFKQDTYC